MVRHGFRPWRLLVNDPCLTCWRLCSHPHYPLACRSSEQEEPSRCWRWPDTHTRASFSSFARLHPLLARFSLVPLVPLSFTLFYHLRTYLFLLQNISLSLQNVSLSLFPHSQNVSPHRMSLSLQNVPLSPFPLRMSLLTERLFISSGRLYGVPSAPSSPHWGTVTMTTRALSKKAGVGARERMLLRKKEGGLQSS